MEKGKKQIGKCQFSLIECVVIVIWKINWQKFRLMTAEIEPD